MGGFSYRGTNIGDFGEIYYAPNESERGDYALPYSVNEEQIKGRSGEYYYGAHVNAREFRLRCYYEDLSDQTIEDILSWFGRHTKGRLIFDDREDVYYDVIPNGRVTFEDYKIERCNGLLHQGIMTIFLKAYSPFGKMLNAGTENVEHAANSTTLTIANPGTEPTPLTIKMSGTATRGTITNTTNGQTCVITNMSTGAAYLIIDSETGRVTLDDALAFDKHESGYITLEPNATNTITLSGFTLTKLYTSFIPRVR